MSVASLLLKFLRSPAQAAEDCRRPEALGPCARIYALFVVAYALFFWLKPFDFPERNAAFPREAQTLLFWTKVMLWQPPLEAGWIAFLLGLVAWFRSGSLPLRMAGGVAWTAAPFLLMISYAQFKVFSKPGLALGSALWLGLFVPLWRKLSQSEWRPIAAFMLGLNAIGLAILAPMIGAAIADSPGAFKFVQAAGGLWILGAGTAGLRRLTGLRLPRAFMAVLFSMFFQIALAFTLHLLGIVPKDILKALLYA